MNTIIEICRLRIKINDSYTKEVIRDIVELKLIFFQNYNLLMYSKIILAQFADKSDSSKIEKKLDSSVSLFKNNELLI